MYSLERVYMDQGDVLAVHTYALQHDTHVDADCLTYTHTHTHTHTHTPHLPSHLPPHTLPPPPHTHTFYIQPPQPSCCSARNARRLSTLLSFLLSPFTSLTSLSYRLCGNTKRARSCSDTNNGVGMGGVGVGGGVGVLRRGRESIINMTAVGSRASALSIK